MTATALIDVALIVGIMAGFILVEALSTRRMWRETEQVKERLDKARAELDAAFACEGSLRACREVLAGLAEMEGKPIEPGDLFRWSRAYWTGAHPLPERSQQGDGTM